jgi:ABC-type transport system involved in cytochrome c biogenesis permease subunit
MMDSTFFFFLSTPGYFLALLCYLFSVAFPQSGESSGALGITVGMSRLSQVGISWSRWATWMTGFSVLLLTIGVIWRTIEVGIASHWALSVFLPVTTTYETLTFMAWLIPLVYLILERRYPFPGVGAIITGLAFVMLALAALPGIAPREVAPVVPSLQSYWLVIHVLFMIIGISLFTVGFGASVLLLWRRFRGSEPALLQQLEELSYKANLLGFPFYGIGGVVFGGIWAKQAWGAYWEWDPKETAMLIAWLSYAIYLHARLRWGWRDVKVTWLSIVAYLVVLYTWIGINYFVSSLHSFT